MKKKISSTRPKQKSESRENKNAFALRKNKKNGEFENPSLKNGYKRKIGVEPFTNSLPDINSQELFDYCPSPLFLISSKGQILKINNAALEIFKEKLDSLIGQGISYIFPEITPEEIDLLIGKENISKELKVILRTSSDKTTFHLKNILSTEQGASVIVLQKSETIDSEYELLKQLNRTYSLISELNQLILRQESRIQLIREICRLLVEKGNFLMVWFGELDPITKTVIPTIIEGYDDGYLDNVTITVDETITALGPTGRALKSGTYYYCNNIAEDPIMLPWREKALARGYKASVCLALNVLGRADSAITAYSPATHFFTESEIQLLVQVAKNLSYALEHIEIKNLQAKTENALKKSIADWNKTFDAIQDPVWLLDKEQRIIKSNIAAEKYFNISSDKLLHCYCYNIVHHQDSPYKDCPLQKAKISLKREQVEIELSDKYFEVSVDPILDEKGNFAGAVHTMHDITNQKEALRQIRRNDVIFNSLLEHSPVSIYFKDKELKITDLSNNYQQILGLPKEDIIGKTASDLFPSEIAETIIKDEQFVLESGKPLHKNEFYKDRYYQTVMFPINVLDEPPLIAGFKLDVTESMKLQNEIVRREEEFRSLFDNMTEGVAFHELVYDDRGNPVNYRIVNCNFAYESILGLKKEEVIGRLATDVYRMEKAPLLEKYAITAQELQSSHFDVYIPEFERFFEISVIPWSEKGFATIFSDVTARKLQEEKLKNSYQLIDSFIANTYAGVIAADINGIILHINQAYCNLFNLNATPDELIGKRSEVIIPDILKNFADPEYIVSEMNRFIQNQVPVKQVAVELLSGKKLLVDFIPLVIDDKVAGRIWYHHDITELKNAEKKLQQSEEMFRQSFQFAAVGLSLIGTERKFRRVNDSFQSMIEYSAEELYNMTFDDITYPEDRDLTKEKLQLILIGEVTNVSFEKRFVTRSGRIIWSVVSIAPIKNDKGEVEYFISQVLDITDRKTAEEALKDSKKFIEDIIETANTIVIGITLNGEIKIFNKAAERITGYLFEEVKGKNAFDLFSYPENKLTILESVEKIRETGIVPRNYETPILTKSGELRNIVWQNSPMYEDGKLTGVITFGLDTTEKIAAEKALRESEEKYRGILQTAVLGFWLIDLQANILEVNDAYCTMSGYSRDEILRMKIMDFEVEESADQIYRHIQKIIDKRSDRFETKHRRKNGTEYYVEINVQYQALGSGKLVCFLRDITAWKKSELIRETRARLIDYAVDHSSKQLLQYSLDELEKITGSKIGFYHLMLPDQKTLALQEWSTRTKNEFCTAIGTGLHYNVSEAGVWVDAVHQRKPVIHNNYDILLHKKGMPEGHAKVVRELIVPVFRGGLITAVLGLGNKPIDYTQDDVEIVKQVADLAWDIIERKRWEEELHSKLEELKKFHKVTVGRELIMIELKKEVNMLRESLGMQAKYRILDY